MRLKDRSADSLLEELQPWHAKGLHWAKNQGHLDVFPETSGKASLAKHLLQRLDGEAQHSFLLCDDANDLGTPCTAAGPVMLLLVRTLHAHNKLPK